MKFKHRPRRNGANQFSAKLRFVACSWFAVDEETGATCVVRDVATSVRWSITVGDSTERGISKSTQAARAAIRRRIAKLPVRA